MLYGHAVIAAWCGSFYNGFLVRFSHSVVRARFKNSRRASFLVFGRGAEVFTTVFTTVLLCIAGTLCMQGVL